MINAFDFEGAKSMLPRALAAARSVADVTKADVRRSREVELRAS
jgi:hypothetical protein